MPKVSVIIPLYNGSKFIGETLNSVLDQSFKDFEIIVVNDGSTDHPENILNKYNDKIIVINQENSGAPGRAKNSGVQRSSGKYLAFIDQDDLWKKDKLEMQVRILDQQNNIGAVFSNCLVFESSTGKNLGKLWAKVSSFNKEIIQEKLLRDNFIVTTSQVMVRREIVDNNKLFDDQMLLADDYELWYRIALKWDVFLMNEPLTKWRYSQSSLSNNNLKMLLDLVYFYEKALKNTEINPSMKEIAKNKLSVFSFRLGNFYIRKGKYEDSVKAFSVAQKSASNGKLTVSLALAKFCPWMFKFALNAKLKVSNEIFFPRLNLDLTKNE